MTTSSKKNRKQKTSPELKIARAILIVLGAMSMLSYFSGCKSTRPIVENTDSTVEMYIERDKLVAVAIPGESANMTAIFECDSLNNVLLKNIDELKSKNMNSAFSFVNGQLSYKAVSEPDSAFIKTTDRWHTIHKHTKKTITINKTTVVKVKDFYWKFGVWAFWLSLLALIAYAIYRLSKLPGIKNKIQLLIEILKLK